MEKYSDVDIDAMLKRIQENVEKRSPAAEESEAPADVAQKGGKKSPDELIDLIMADIGEDSVKKTKSADAEKYDISGFEIEEIEDDEDSGATEEVELIDSDERPEETGTTLDIEQMDSENEESSDLCENDESELDGEPVENTDVYEKEETEEDVVSEDEVLEDELEESFEELEELPESLTREDFFEEFNNDTETDDNGENFDEQDESESEPLQAIEDISIDDEAATEVFEELSAEVDESAETDEDTVEAIEELTGVVDEAFDDVDEMIDLSDEIADNTETLDETEKVISAEVRDVETEDLGDEGEMDDVLRNLLALAQNNLEEPETVAIEDVTSAFSKQGDVTPTHLTENDEKNGVYPDSVAPDEYHSLDEADINLTISLGNKDSLEDAIGFVKVREAKHNFVNPSEKGTVGNIILDYRTNEYTSDDEEDDIKDRYRKEKKHIALRLGVSAFLFVLLAFCEMIYSFDSVSIPYISEFLDVPLYYGLVSVLLMVVAVALSAKKLFLGIVGFFMSRPNYYSTVSFVFLVNLLYSILSITVFGDDNMLMLNSIVIFGLLLDIVGEYFQISREMLTFKFVSDGRPKIALERLDITADTIKKQSFLTGNDFVIEDINFVGKYFERSAKSPQSYQVRYSYTMLTMLLALLVAVVAVIVTDDFAYFVFAFELSIMLSIPTQFMFLGSLPFYIVSGNLRELDSAIIGETIDDEYVGPHTVYMDDTEIFGKRGIRVLNLEPHNGFNIVDVNYYYLSIFMKLNSPLKNAFGEVSEKMKLSDSVRFLSVYQSGIEALVDEKNRILVGKYDFMVEKGVQFGKCHDEKPIEKDDICVMYMSVNGAICAKMNLKYDIDHYFEQFADDMAENRVHVGVRTVDPNVTEAMIARLRGDNSESIKVMRPTFNDLVPIERKSNSGIITAKNSHMIAQILAEGLKIKRTNSIMNILWIIYALVGLCSVIVISVFGVFDKVFPICIVGYQLAWIIGFVIYTINKFRNRKTK